MSHPHPLPHTTSLHHLQLLLMALLVLTIAIGCARESDADDGMGHFETDEATVVAMASGEVVQLSVTEGQQVQRGMVVGMIENSQLLAQREELRTTLQQIENDRELALSQDEMERHRKADLEKQATSLRQQIAEVLGEKDHYADLYEKGVVSRNQVEAFDIRLDMLEKQLAQIEEQIANSVIADDGTHGLSRDEASRRCDELQSQLAQIDSQLTGIQVTCPINGTITEKNAGEGDYVAAGSPLFKVADLSRMTLLAYLSSEKSALLKVGSKVKVAVEAGLASPREYFGIVMWVSPQAEFGGKPVGSADGTTRDFTGGRHIVKVEVENDGHIAIGMRGRLVLTE